LGVFRKSVAQDKVSLNYDKTSGYFIWRPIYIFDHIISFIIS